MNDETIETLIALNRRFYEQVAASFVDKRQRPWRGWRRLLPLVSPGARMLDVACGHGRFVAFLEAERPDPGREVVGVDTSPALLAEARARFPSMRLVERDVLRGPLDDLGAFDLVVCFGLLHHVPSAALRRRFVQRLAERVAPGGALVFALWRVDPTGDKRRPPLEGLDLEPGDLFLGWGPHPDAVRYCHDVDDAEAEALVAATGLALTDDFRDDGTGDRNRYLVLKA